MRIEIGNSTCVVREADPACAEILYRVLSFAREGEPTPRPSWWDERVRLYHKEKHTFPTGLLPRALEAIKHEPGARGLSLVDQRGALPPPSQERREALQSPPWSMTGKYGFQLEALDSVGGGALPGRAVIQAPTGSGKGNIAAALPFLYPDMRWVFLVHRANLARDVCARWEELAGEGTAGFIGEGEWREGERFTAALLPTLGGGHPSLPTVPGAGGEDHSPGGGRVPHPGGSHPLPGGPAFRTRSPTRGAIGHALRSER